VLLVERDDVEDAETVTTTTKTAHEGGLRRSLGK
jgi:hypothetical protein